MGGRGSRKKLLAFCCELRRGGVNKHAGGHEITGDSHVVDGAEFGRVLGSIREIQTREKRVALFMIAYSLPQVQLVTKYVYLIIQCFCVILWRFDKPTS